MPAGCGYRRAHVAGTNPGDRHARGSDHRASHTTINKLSIFHMKEKMMTRVASDKKAKTVAPVQAAPQGWLSADELRKMNAYWRACNYLAAGMIYLRDNPLLREPLKPEHVKLRLLGHWGASPGLSFTYIHLNRLINKFDLDAIFLAGPGHGAPGVLAPVYLEGAYSEIYPNKGEDLDGMREFFKEFSFPGGIGSHCT